MMSEEILEVIESRVELHPMGDKYVGLCPFHEEKTPSFSVDAIKQSYHCFGCGANGDVESFVDRYDGVGLVSIAHPCSDTPEPDEASDDSFETAEITLPEQADAPDGVVLIRADKLWAEKLLEGLLMKAKTEPLSYEDKVKLKELLEKRETE